MWSYSGVIVGLPKVIQKRIQGARCRSEVFSYRNFNCTYFPWYDCMFFAGRSVANGTEFLWKIFVEFMVNPTQELFRENVCFGLFVEFELKRFLNFDVRSCFKLQIFLSRFGGIVSVHRPRDIGRVSGMPLNQV